MTGRSLIALASVVILGIALGWTTRLLLSYYGSADMTIAVFLTKLPGCW